MDDLHQTDSPIQPHLPTLEVPHWEIKYLFDQSRFSRSYRGTMRLIVLWKSWDVRSIDMACSTICVGLKQLEPESIYGMTFG